MSTKNVDAITSGQCRAARGLLEITQTDLADLANLGLSTIVDFEKARREISSEAKRSIRKALEKAGVEFIAENGGGPGVRLRKTKR
jgi:predicted transcriptional regulator